MAHFENPKRLHDQSANERLASFNGQQAPGSPRGRGSCHIFAKIQPYVMRIAFFFRAISAERGGKSPCFALSPHFRMSFMAKGSTESPGTRTSVTALARSEIDLSARQPVGLSEVEERRQTFSVISLKGQRDVSGMDIRLFAS